jgi:peptidyl-prolyl cis-trans isomerase SurA
MKIIFNLIFPMITLLTFSSIAENKIDGIAAVVGDEIILLSELNAYTTLRLNSLGLKPESIDSLKYKNEFLNEIIDGKILLVHGKKDTTISVSDEEVEQATNNHISMLLKQNNISLDSLEVELQKQQGISLVKFKSDARKIIREQLIKQKVQQTYLYSTKITRKDVESFYKEYKDSLPEIGESVLLSKLSLNVLPSEKEKQAAFDKIKFVKQQLQNGVDFESCAKKYSDGPEAQDGGNLGFITKGSLNEITFEEKAFNLPVGQISEPFETRLGFHILKVVERRDQKVHLKQIFIKVEPPQKEVDKIYQKIDSIRFSCKNKVAFSNAIQLFSQDPATKSNKGELGWIPTIELPPEIKGVIDSLTIDSISKPIKDNHIISIYRLDNKVSKRSLTLDNDYFILENKAKEILVQKKLIELVTNWRKTIFVDIRI